MKAIFASVAASPLILRGLEVVVAVGLLVGLGYSWDIIHAKRVAVLEAQQQLEESPTELLRQEAASMDLRKSAATLTTVRALFVTRAAVSTFVGRLESEARQAGVAVTIPDIREDVTLGKDQKPTTPTGPYQDVLMTIRATGNPLQLLRYLHTLEHLPYVTHVPEWNLTTQNTSSTAEVIAPPPPEQSAVSGGGSPAILEATVVVTIAENNAP